MPNTPDKPKRPDVGAIKARYSESEYVDLPLLVLPPYLLQAVEAYFTRHQKHEEERDEAMFAAAPDPENGG